MWLGISVDVLGQSLSPTHCELLCDRSEHSCNGTIQMFALTLTNCYRLVKRKQSPGGTPTRHQGVFVEPFSLLLINTHT